MSFNGLEKLRMGYVPPRPPPILPLVPDGVKPAITLDDAFDAWVMTPADDLRTLQEYASNPVPLVRRKPDPPPAPPRKREDRRATMLELPPTMPTYAAFIETGTISSSKLQAGVIQDTDGVLREMTDALEKDLNMVIQMSTCFHDPDPEDRCPHGGDYRLCKKCNSSFDPYRCAHGVLWDDCPDCRH